MTNIRESFDINIDELEESNEVAVQPSRAKIQLKQHQLTLLARCIAFEKNNIRMDSVPSLSHLQTWQPEDYIRTRIGIIGDKAGSGKSYVVLSLLLENDNIQDDRILRTYGCNRVIMCTRDVTKQSPASMLVIPHNMCAQWDGYIKAFMPSDFKYYMVNNSKSTHALHEINIDDYGLFVVTCTCYNRVAQILWSKSRKFKRLIFDEIDNANLPSCMQIDASFTWFVTASFGNLLHPRGHSGWDYSMNKYVWHATGLKNSGFVKNIFIDLYNQVARDYVKVLVIKNSDAYVMRSIEIPPSVSNFVLCRTPATIHLLHGVVDNGIIESLNAGDITSALAQVSSNNKNTEENIVAAILDKFQRSAHSLESRIAFATTAPADTYESDVERETEIARLRKRMSDVAHRMASIKERICKSDMCCICYDDIEHKTITQCCSNSYCFKCISLWLARARNSVCPLCKTSITSKDLMVVHDHQHEDDVGGGGTPSNTLSDINDKNKNLEFILKNRMAEEASHVQNRCAKFLIFASYENTFSTIVSVLDKVGISYAFLKGNHDVVKNIVKRYKEGQLDVLLVNTRNYGSGLNLENTSDIIMFHKFDNEIEKQVIGRANRMGRTTPLKVWYLLYENEMHRATAL